MQTRDSTGLTLAAAVLLVALLAPRLGPLLLPVIVYGLALNGMAWQAWERAARVGSPGARLAAWGAALFVLSDSVLAVNRFLQPFAANVIVVMCTYIAAQTLIAMSVSAAFPVASSGGRAGAHQTGR